MSREVRAEHATLKLFAFCGVAFAYRELGLSPTAAEISIQRWLIVLLFF